MWPPPPPPSSVVARQAGGEWTTWALATIASIWTAVLVISVLSPDMIHGSAQQRLPVAALGTWLWGGGASIAAFMGMARLRDVGRRSSWIIVFGATVAIWTAATLISILGPTTVTGSDPTTIPMAALIAPIVAMVATFVTVTVVTVA